MGRDGRIPDGAGGHHGMQLPEQGGGDRRLVLGGLERMLRTGGQVGVAGGVDRVVPQGPPDGPPRGETESGAASPGEARLAGERP